MVSRSIENSQGVIVEATLEQLRKAAATVLWEYTEIEETPKNEERASDGQIAVGEAILFRENMDVCPAEIVAIRLGVENLWFLISTSECPETKCATAREAMRCAQSEEKRLRKIKEFFHTEGTEVKEVHKWEPDKLADAQDIIKIIADASRRYSH